MVKHNKKTSKKITKAFSTEPEATPLVSIYMPTFNRAGLLQRATESVLKQEYKEIELLVVVDGYDTESIDYLLSVNDHRLRFFVNSKNMGACYSRNIAINNARGEYITGIDDDDLFLPDRITNFVKLSNVINDKTIALYTDTFFYTGKKYKRYKRPLKTKKEDLVFSNYIGNQIFTKTDYLKKIGGFDPAFNSWQDLECWFRLLDCKGSYARKAAGSTYIVDKSHPHERISTKKIDNIDDAWSKLCSKHSLKDNQKHLLFNQTFSYDINRSSFLRAIKTYFIIHSSRGTAIVLKNVFKKWYRVLKNFRQLD